MLGEQLIHERTDRSFLLIRHKLLVLPAITKRCRPAERLTEFRAYGHRRGDTVRDFFTLPLSHRGDNRKEQSSCGTAGIYRFREAHHVRSGIAECVCEIEKFACVARKARDLAENKTRDMARLDIREHPLCFRMLHYRLTAYRFQAIDLTDFPFARFRVHASALFVRFGTFTPCLVFGADANPNPDAFF
jgi:hypothetical protein